jgi:hypothetical protein
MGGIIIYMYLSDSGAFTCVFSHLFSHLFIENLILDTPISKKHLLFGKQGGSSISDVRMSIGR